MIFVDFIVFCAEIIIGTLLLCIKNILIPMYILIGPVGIFCLVFFLLVVFKLFQPTRIKEAKEA